MCINRKAPKASTVNFDQGVLVVVTQKRVLRYYIAKIGRGTNKVGIVKYIQSKGATVTFIQVF